MNSQKFLQKFQKRAPDLRRTDLYSLIHYHLAVRHWKHYPDFEFRLSPPPQEPERILVIQLSSIGDVTYTIPALFALKERYPTAELHFLTETNCAVGVRGHPAVDKFWTLPVDNWLDLLNNGEQATVTVELRNTINQLKRCEIDYLLNLHTSPLAALLARMIEPASFGGGYLDEKLMPVVVGNRHHFSRYINISYPLITAASSSLFVDTRPSSLRFYARKEQNIESEIKNKLNKYHQPEKKLILLNTGSRMEGRVWPAHHCAQVARQLLENGYEVGLIGGPEDEARLKEVRRLNDSDENLVPWFKYTGSLLEDMHLADHATLTITTDSGPQHLISCRGNSCLVLAGDIWVGPWNCQSYTLRAAEGKISNLEKNTIVNNCEKLLAGEQLDQPQESDTVIFQGRPRTNSFWYNHFPVGEVSPSPSKMKQWLKKMFFLVHWDRQVRELGWRGLNLEPAGIREVYDNYWSASPPEVSEFSPSEVEQFGRMKVNSPGELSEKFSRWEEKFYFG